MRTLLAALLFLATATTAAAQSWLVNDTTNVIEAYTEVASPRAEAGSTWVADSVIKAATTKILQGGTWDGTSYSPPAGILDTTAVEYRRTQLARMLQANWMPFVTPALGTRDLEKITSQINALLRAITQDANMRADNTYLNLHAEVSISGGSFLRYANAQWVGSGGHYNSATGGNFPTGTWSLHTIHEAVNAGTAANNGTAGSAHSGFVLDKSSNAAFNWPIQLMRLVAP